MANKVWLFINILMIKTQPISHPLSLSSHSNGCTFQLRANCIISRLIDSSFSIIGVKMLWLKSSSCFFTTHKSLIPAVNRWEFNYLSRREKKFLAKLFQLQIFWFTLRQFTPSPPHFNSLKCLIGVSNSWQLDLINLLLVVVFFGVVLATSPCYEFYVNPKCSSYLFAWGMENTFYGFLSSLYISLGTLHSAPRKPGETRT